LNRNAFFSILLLTLVWIVLRENFSVFEAGAGVVIGICCLYFCRRYLPFPKFGKINFFLIFFYPFYLIFQIYLSGFNVIKLIFTDAQADIVEVKTKIKNDFARAVLANSITLIPGSISLELKEDVITVLWLKRKSKDSRDAESAAMFIKRKLERILVKI